jgi:anti-sigma B factor antagonist
MLPDLTVVGTFGVRFKRQPPSARRGSTGGPDASSRRELVVAVGHLHEPVGLMLHLQSGEGRSRLSLVGELDLATADDLVEFVRSLTGRHELLLLDLALLDFIDACGLRALLHVQQLVAERGGSLRLSRPRPWVRKLLALTGLDTVLPMDAPADEAGARNGDVCVGSLSPDPRGTRW